MLSIIVAILTSGVIVALVTFFLNAYKEERNHKREKLEKLYIHTMRWIKWLDVYCMYSLNVMCEKITLDQMNEMLIEKKESEKNHFENMQMIIGIYFSRLKGNLDELLSCKESLISIFEEFKEGYKKGEARGGRFKNEFAKEIVRLDIIEEKFQKAIFSEANAIGRPWKKVKR